MCMTEVEKFQGKFLERQRQAKLAAKNDKKIAKATGSTEDSEETKVAKVNEKRKDSNAEDEAAAK